MLLGRLHELGEESFRDGGHLEEIREEAVDASIALLSPWLKA
jgi:hypothetical protein